MEYSVEVEALLGVMPLKIADGVVKLHRDDDGVGRGYLPSAVELDESWAGSDPARIARMGLLRPLFAPLYGLPPRSPNGSCSRASATIEIEAIESFVVDPNDANER